MTYQQLDEALAPPGSIWDRQTYRYVKKDRAPLASAIQGLEQRVANLTKRKARRIAVFTTSKRTFLGYPKEFHDLWRTGASTKRLRTRFLLLAYEDRWPTFFDLIDVNQTRLDKSIGLASWCWQWGPLWEKGWPGLERSEFGFPADEPLESVIRKLGSIAEIEMASRNTSRTRRFSTAIEWQLHKTSPLQEMPKGIVSIDRRWVDGDRTAEDLLAGRLTSKVVDLPANKAAFRLVEEPVMLEIRKGVFRWGRLV